MFKKLTIISICILIIVSLVMSLNVFATEYNSASEYWADQPRNKTYDLIPTSRVEVEGSETNFYFNTVENKKYVSLFFIGKTETEANNGYYYLIVWHDYQLKISVNGKVTTDENEMFYTKSLISMEQVDETIFGDVSTVDPNSGKTTYVFQTIFSDNANGKYTGSEGMTSIVQMTMEEYYIANVSTSDIPTDEENETNGLLGSILNWIKKIPQKLEELIDNTVAWFDTLVISVQAVPENIGEIIKDIFKVTSGGIVFDTVAELVNDNLVNNKFYTSVTKVKATLTSIFAEDYSSRTGFYELDLPFNNFSLGKVQNKVYKNFGNEIIGEWEQEYNTSYGSGIVDWGLNNVNLINLDWFFGKEFEDGYYTKGVKDYSDKIIGSFMWLVFGWWLWHNLPDLMMGEIGNVSSLTNTKYTKSENTSKTKTKKEDKKE